MSKRDRQCVRTPADIERKYTLADIGKAQQASASATTQVARLGVEMGQQAKQTDAKIAAITETANAAAASAAAAIAGMEQVWNLVYPVGSIYMSVNSASPEVLFGGTWERIQDTFLLAAGNSYAAGETGGEAAHTLTVDEMPSHSHDFIRSTGTVASGANRSSANTGGTALAGVIGNTGGDQPHNNMPPYLAVYMWQRTA